MLSSSDLTEFRYPWRQPRNVRRCSGWRPLKLPIKSTLTCVSRHPSLPLELEETRRRGTRREREKRADDEDSEEPIIDTYLYFKSLSARLFMPVLSSHARIRLMSNLLWTLTSRPPFRWLQVDCLSGIHLTMKSPCTAFTRRCQSRVIFLLWPVGTYIAQMPSTWSSPTLGTLQKGGCWTHE